MPLPLTVNIDTSLIPVTALITVSLGCVFEPTRVPTMTWIKGIPHAQRNPSIDNRLHSFRMQHLGAVESELANLLIRHIG